MYNVPVFRSSVNFFTRNPRITHIPPKASRAFASSRRLSVSVLPEQDPRPFTPQYTHLRTRQTRADVQRLPDSSSDQRNLKQRLHRTPNCVHTEVMSPTVTVESIHERNTGTWQYIVVDPRSLHALIIDPVLDYDAATNTISTNTADGLKSLIEAKGYSIVRILETHAHADHLTAAAYLQSILGRDQGFKPPVCIGKRIREVQRVFGRRYEVPEDDLDSAFDHLLDDDEEFQIGQLRAKVVHLPGHTPDHVGYLIEGSYPYPDRQQLKAG